MVEIGAELGVTDGRAQQLVASADDRIEVVARAREWSLHTTDPEEWRHRFPLDVGEELHGLMPLRVWPNRVHQRAALPRFEIPGRTGRKRKLLPLHHR